MPFQTFVVPSLIATDYGRVWNPPDQPEELVMAYQEVAAFLHFPVGQLPFGALECIRAYSNRHNRATLRYLPCTADSIPGQRIAEEARDGKGRLFWHFFDPTILERPPTRGMLHRNLVEKRSLQVVVVPRISA